MAAGVTVQLVPALRAFGLAIAGFRRVERGRLAVNAGRAQQQQRGGRLCRHRRDPRSGSLGWISASTRRFSRIRSSVLAISGRGRTMGRRDLAPASATTPFPAGAWLPPRAGVAPPTPAPASSDRRTRRSGRVPGRTPGAPRPPSRWPAAARDQISICARARTAAAQALPAPVVEAARAQGSPRGRG